MSGQVAVWMCRNEGAGSVWDVVRIMGSSWCGCRE